MFYKQKDSGGKIITIGQTVDNITLPNNYIQISKSEYNSLQRILSMELETPTLTPLNEKGEIIYKTVI